MREYPQTTDVFEDLGVVAEELRFGDLKFALGGPVAQEVLQFLVCGAFRSFQADTWIGGQNQEKLPADFDRGACFGCAYRIEMFCDNVFCL